MELLLSRSKIGQSKMVARMFQAHGQLCASRPWEAIIGTVTMTVCLMSMSLFSSNNKICGWNYACVGESEADLSSDRIILTITRCLAVMYIYLQFRNLRRLGSKYLLGIAGLFTIFSSFVFSIAVINLMGSDLSGLNEALPFFLLLIDLAKASALAKFALSAKCQDEVIDNIGRGMAVLGPAITLDALVEILVIGVGTLSGVARLETMCCFGCMSVLANYLAFMTFYPACLALFLEMSHGRPLLQLTDCVLRDEEDEKPNPVTQRVKIIMSAGLVLVHAHSRLLAGSNDDEGVIPSGKMSDLLNTHYVTPQEPLWQFYLKKATSIDYTLTFILAAVLAFKYIVYDSDEELEKQLSSNASSSSTLQAAADDLKRKSEDESDADLSMEQAICPQPPTVDLGHRKHTASFTLGDESSEESEADIEKQSVAVQTDSELLFDNSRKSESVGPPRSLDECVRILQSEEGPSILTDEEVILLVRNKKIPSYKLENILGDHQRGVSVRRQLLERDVKDPEAFRALPYTNYDYKYVDGACCENVIGYMPVPVGVAGPLLLDGEKYMIPMATTEGCLVASTNRGCRALSMSGGVTSTLIGNAMTRAPVVRFPSAKQASEVKVWLEDEDNFKLVKEAFRGSSRFTALQCVKVIQASRNLYIRFVAATGDAMGMNMVSKGAEQALKMLQEKYFPDMEIISLSGNFCTDKKPSAVNWIEGRGKSVVCEAIIPEHVIRDVLKTSVQALIDLNISKNLIGSALAGSIGGFNAHAANVVTALYIATGQDPAQNVCSSNCMTIMEATGINGEDLYVSCTMPSIEVGTVGGGTILPPQAACLQMLGVRGASKEDPGKNACMLARVVCAGVLAGELSLMSALAAGHLVKSHLKHNRSVLNISSPSKVPTTPSADGKLTLPERPTLQRSTASNLDAVKKNFPDHNS